MIPWELLDRALIPGTDKELVLHKRGGDFSIRLDGMELMTSRVHGSEEALAELACAPVAGRIAPRALVGGLGMGYTLAAALSRLGPTAQVEVAELVPGVVEWNRGPLASLAGRPLEDHRVRVRQDDITAVLRSEPGGYDTIMNDVDNGPDGLLLSENAFLYSQAGLALTRAALRPRGVLTVWSVGPNVAFTERLHKAGFDAREVRLRDSGGCRGRRHTIWVASLP